MKKKKTAEPNRITSFLTFIRVNPNTGRRQLHCLRPAIRRDLKQRKGKLLAGDADVEEDDAGERIGDDDSPNGKPEEELLLLEPDDAAESAVAEVAANHPVEEGRPVVLGVAGPVEPDLEKTVGPVEGVGVDGLGKKARREAMLAEEVVDRDGDVSGGMWG